jgi:ADP-ribosyl-[dinitrogen reductase] hydrolase
MTRTSLTHPLQIAAISAGAGLGSVGVTFCPGKRDRNAMTGAWHRDLGVDLDAIKAWGASTVITLITQEEFSLLGVDSLGEEVMRRQMTWLHLPIVDVSIPDSKFEAQWVTVSDDLHKELHTGKNILVHCRGGLGRAGTIAARLLVELGCSPADAILKVRSARPGAIETREQEAYVMKIKAKGAR